MTLADTLAALSEPVQNTALKAISRLIGGVAAYPAAWLRRGSQTVEDYTDGRTLVRKALAAKVSELAVNDPDLMERAKQRFLGDLYRKQSNLEAISHTTCRELKTHPPQHTTAEIDDDWLDVFSKYAQDASSERLQALWAAVLAGQIRRSGAYSLATLRFLSELDGHVAEEFSAFCQGRIGKFVIREEIEGFTSVGSEQLILLQSLGLIIGIEGSISETISFDQDGIGILTGDAYGLRLYRRDRYPLTLTIIALTRLGYELASLMEQPAEIENLKQLTTFFSHRGPNKIELIRLDSDADDGRLLWEAPSQP